MWCGGNPEPPKLAGPLSEVDCAQAPAHVYIILFEHIFCQEYLAQIVLKLDVLRKV